MSPRSCAEARGPRHSPNITVIRSVKITLAHTVSLFGFICSSVSFSLPPCRRRFQSAGALETHSLYPGVNHVSVPYCSPVWSKLLTRVFATRTYLLGLEAGV